MAGKEKQTVLVQNSVPSALGRVFDPPRDENRVRVRVRFRPGAAPKVIGGQRIKPSDVKDDGWAYPTPLYESDAARLEELVEDDERAIARAREAHDRKLDQYVKRQLRDVVDPQKIALARIEVERTYTGSIEAEFFSLTGRGMKPFIACEVLETGLRPPETEQERQVRTIAEVAFRGHRMSASAHEDGAELADLRKDNAELKAQLAESIKINDAIMKRLGALESAVAKSSSRKNG